MTLAITVVLQDATQHQLAGNVKEDELEWTENAEEGNAGISTFLVDDPDGTLEMDQWGWADFVITESAVSPPGPDQRSYWGYILSAKVMRGEWRTGAARVWEVQVSDVNARLQTRVMVGNDNDRPVETDVARVNWLLDTTEGGFIGNDDFVASTPTTSMDDVDYLGQERNAVLRDCAEASGKNFYLYYIGSTIGIWYDLPGSEEYPSEGSITNYRDEVDQSTVFYAGLEDDLDITWERVYANVFMSYRDSYVYVTRPQTTARYIYRDVNMQGPNVKSKAAALRRANRMADDLATPDHNATVHVIVSAADVNKFRQGMNVPVKMSHWPEPYRSEYTVMRCLSRTVRKLSDDPDNAYFLTLRLTRSEPGPPAPAAAAWLGFAWMKPGTATGGGLVEWERSGDDVGNPEPDTSAFFTKSTDGVVKLTYSGWEVNGTGTISVRFIGSALGVRNKGKSYTITWSIRKNGAIVASEVTTLPVIGDLGDLTSAKVAATVEAIDIPVVPGDVITATVFCTPQNLANFKVPAGTGQNQESLRIFESNLS